MAKIFLADTENYVEITQEHAFITLSEICQNFQVDATSAYIRRAGSGAVVATLPTDTLPDILTTSEYILCANNSSSNGTGTSQTLLRLHEDNNNNSDANEEAELQHAVLRMAQLVDSVTSTSSSSGAAATSLLNASEEERQALASFFSKSKTTESSSSSTRHQMFVTSDVKSTHYCPTGLSQLLSSLPRKNVNVEKYSFVDGY
jgi:hypothetical protein